MSFGGGNGLKNFMMFNEIYNWRLNGLLDSEKSMGKWMDYNIYTVPLLELDKKNKKTKTIFQLIKILFEWSTIDS